MACGRASSLNQLVGWLNAALGTDLAPIYEPPRPADIRQEGLRRTATWFKEHEC